MHSIFMVVSFLLLHLLVVCCTCLVPYCVYGPFPSICAYVVCVFIVCLSVVNPLLPCLFCVSLSLAMAVVDGLVLLVW